MSLWSKYRGTILGSTLGPVGGLIGYSMVDQPRQMQQEAQDAADEEQRRVEAAIAQRNANVAQLRGLFGVGDSAEAKANQQSIAEAINRYYQQYLQQGLGEAERGFSTTSRTSRQNLARVGQLGSGLDASAQQGTLSDFIRARQRAISGAASAKNSLTSSLTSQRLGLENQIASGTQANPDFGAYAAQRDSTLSQAQNNIVPQQLGNMFSAAGQAYFQGRQQEAMGNQGLQAFGFSNNGSSGRVS